jgi:RNA polymerase sigma-70 factor (ECF subfamily)
MQSHEPTEQCREVFALLSDYLNLDLPPDACKTIEAHLAGCPPCIEFTESLRKTIEICRQFQPAEMPGPLAKQAREELLGAYRKMLAGRRAGL